MPFVPDSATPFLRILFVPAGWLYNVEVGGGWRIEKPCWLRRVFLRPVGLFGEGEIGVRGIGDLVVDVLMESEGTASESFGRAARASIENPKVGIYLGEVMTLYDADKWRWGTYYG